MSRSGPLLVQQLSNLLHLVCVSLHLTLSAQRRCSSPCRLASSQTLDVGGCSQLGHGGRGSGSVLNACLRATTRRQNVRRLLEHLPCLFLRPNGLHRVVQKAVQQVARLSERCLRRPGSHQRGFPSPAVPPKQALYPSCSGNLGVVPRHCHSLLCLNPHSSIPASDLPAPCQSLDSHNRNVLQRRLFLCQGSKALQLCSSLLFLHLGHLCPRLGTPRPHFLSQAVGRLQLRFGCGRLSVAEASPWFASNLPAPSK
mmetsp:Transcript_62640/g.148378  ORF Transcript_62640/g.148378 Transcript_62640/m.148378 type:complete len:255 (-) Transcript_62640:175-939(-)